MGSNKSCCRLNGNGLILKPLVVELMSFDSAMASRRGAAMIIVKVVFVVGSFDVGFWW